MMCIEDLPVRDISGSAAGEAENPAKQVRAKSGLNRSTLGQGRFEVRRQLDYKLGWNGGHFIYVPPQNTSRTCQSCGHVSAHNLQSQARFAREVSGIEPPAAVIPRSDSFQFDAGTGAVAVPEL